MPKACSVLLVRDEAALGAAFAHEEAYMPHPDAVPNPVDVTLEYSRPLRALKLWLGFRTHGAAAFREAITATLAVARMAFDRGRMMPGFQVLDTPPQLSVVPLRHVPAGTADVDAHQRRLCRAIERDGRVFLSPAVIDGEVWLRPCFTNFRTRPEDVDVMLAVISELSERLARDG